MVTYILLLG